MATTFSKIVAELIGTTGEISADKLAPGAGGTDWTTAVQTSDFTAENNKGYYLNTSGGAIRVTLPASPTAGSVVSIVDAAGSADSNRITLNPNGENINGDVYELDIDVERGGAQLTYSSTYGWVATEAVNSLEGTNRTGKILVESHPVVTSLVNTTDSLAYFQADNDQVKLTGRNLRPGSIISFVKASGGSPIDYTTNVNGSEFNAARTEITFNIPAGLDDDAANDPFDVYVTLPTSSDNPTIPLVSATVEDIIEWLPSPTFTVPSGSLGYIYYDNASITAIAGGNSSSLSTNSYQLDAVSLDTDDSVGNYTVTAGSLPAGISLNSSTGALSGSVTAPAAGSDVSTFTVEATATSGSETKTETREYSIETRGTKVTSVSPTNYDGSAGSTLTLTGRGFSGTGNSEVSNVKLIFTDIPSEPDTPTYPITTLVKDTDFTVDNDTTITITTPNNITVAQADTGIDIEVELVDGYTYKLSENTSPTLLLAGSVPAASYVTGTSYNLTNVITSARGSYSDTIPTATDADGNTTFTYTLGTVTQTIDGVTTNLSDNAYNFNFTLNSTTGALTATVPTNYESTGGSGIITLPVTIEDNAGNTVTQNYTITVDQIQQSIYTTEIATSAMFDGSSYLSKTFGTATQNRKWTFSAWVKVSKHTGHTPLMEAFTGGTDQYHSIFLDGSGQFSTTMDTGSGGVIDVNSTGLLRDFSAWYHLILAYDTIDSSLNLNHRFYINGVDRTETTSISYTGNPYINSTNILHRIGFRWGTISTTYGQALNGYLADIYFIDGQALTPSSFGEYATQGTDVYWIPKEYGTTGDPLDNYGNNGFHLKFDDSTFATYGLGKDSSGRGNHWTPSA